MVTSDAIKRFSKTILKENLIKPTSYKEHNIKHGLRNEDGTGVLVGITNIAEVKGYEMIDGKKVPAKGELFYRGISLENFLNGIEKEGRFGFEEVIYLLLFNHLPTQKDLDDFKTVLSRYYVFPDDYIEDVIIKIPANNIMNKLQRAFLTLYSYDECADDTSVSNVLEQSLSLIAKAPIIMTYSYYVKRHYYDGGSLILHPPRVDYSMAENILHMVRMDSKFTKEEAHLLDFLMIAQAEHGGGNNSTFATHVVSSTGTDTYSALSTAVGSLKGPKHGGANLKVYDMIQHIKEYVHDYENNESLKLYLEKILNKEAYDQMGLIYGIGHAVYTISDARVSLIREKCKSLAKQKGLEKELQLILDIEDIGGSLIQDTKGLNFKPSGNIDLFSSFIMELLEIPLELFTPIFAISRMAGWSAHRLEQILDTKIMRPGYVTLGDKKDFIPMKDREKAT